MRTHMDGRPRRRRWPLRVLWALTAALCALTLVSAGAYVFAMDRYAGHIGRIPDAFSGLDQTTRPAADSAVPATTFLLVGTDSRADGPTTGSDATDSDTGSRSDAIMLVQIADGGNGAIVISIPRDSWVRIPGHGVDKINAAYAFGGPPLLIATVESLTDVRIEHFAAIDFAAIDFAGFEAITDALGGVTVNVAEQTQSRGVTFHPGPNRLDGASALIYVRQRHDLPGSDFDRVQRQQNFLRAVLAEVQAHDLLGSPAKSDKLLRAVTGAVSVDDSLTTNDLLAMARELSHLTADNVHFLTAPVAGVGWEGPQSVVHLDQPALEQMMSQLRAGAVAQHAAEYKELPAIPN